MNTEVEVLGKTGIPNLYPRPPAQYLKAMHNPDFSEFRLIKGMDTPAVVMETPPFRWVTM
jgi:hypothetical protein